MKLKKSLMGCICLLFILSKLSSQELKAGDRLPDIELRNVINYSSSTLKLSDFKGKLIILDFWGTGCSSCIQAFPKIDSLQKEFDGKVQIIAINKESRDSTESFLKKHKKIVLPHLPFITGDSILSSLFPHLYVPHHIWIDSNRTIKYITGEYNNTRENISAFLKGMHLNLTEKKDVFDFDFDKPFMNEGNGRWLDKVEYYSYIMHHIPGVNTGFHRGNDKDGNIRLYSTSSALELFKIALGKGDNWKFISKNEIVLNVKNKEMFEMPSGDDIDLWGSKYYYIYDLFLPATKANQLYDIMNQDLERYFDIEARVEKRKIKCLALVRTSKKDKFSATKEKSSTMRKAIMLDSLWGEWSGKADDFALGLTLLLSKTIQTPVINRTNYHDSVCIGIDKFIADSRNLIEIRKELKRYDLDLIEEYLPREVLIINEKGYRRDSPNRKNY